MNNILDMASLVQIFIYTTVELLIKQLPYLSTLKLKNKSETDFFSRPGPRLMRDTQHSTLNVFKLGNPECGV